MIVRACACYTCARAWYNSIMPFRCSQCGECCRVINCPFLRGNLCSIYAMRPMVCRVDALYKYLHLSDVMSLDEYYNANYRACKELQDSHSLGL